MIWTKLKSSIIEFDPVNLGNSFILYFLLAYISLPAIILFFPNIKPIASLLHSQPTFFSFYYYSFTAVSIFSFIFGFRYARIDDFAERIRSAWDYKWQPLRTLSVFIVVFGLGLIIKAIRIYNGGFSYLDRNPSFTSHPLYSLVGLFDWMGTISLVIALIAYYLYFLKHGDRRFAIWRYIAWATMTFEVVSGFLIGARGTVIAPLVAYVIVRYYIQERGTKYTITSFFIMFLILMPLLNINRSPGVFLSSYHVIEKEELISVKNTLQDRNFTKLMASIRWPSLERIENFGKYIFDASFLRTDQSRIFLAVLNNVYQFNYGESGIKFFASLGPPRFIWKNKPLIQGSMGEIGKRSGLLAPGDTTSIGPTVVGDWYMNFGIWGIVFGMFFLGALFKFLSEAFISPLHVYPTGLLIFGITWLHTIPQAVEGWMAPLWAGYIKLFVILFVIHLALRGFSLNHKSTRSLNQVAN